MGGLIKIAFMSSALVICLTQASAMERGPLSCADIEYLLHRKISPKRIIELIEQRQTRCQANEQSLSKLKQAGADSDLITAVERGQAVASIVTPPPKTLTGKKKERIENANPAVSKNPPPTPTEKPLRVEVSTNKG